MIQSKVNLKNKKLDYVCGVFALIVITLAVIYHNELRLIYTSPETVKQFIAGFGIFAPITFIFLQILQVVVFIIPSSVFTISGGYAFGTVLGTIYSLIGIMIGSIIVFYFSRKLGRPFVEKIINKKELDHFDVFFEKRGKLALFAARAIPMLFPTDVVSFAGGLTSIRLKDYILFSFLGFIPNLFILTLFGDELSHGINAVALVILTILGFAILGYLFRHPLKVFFIKEIKEYEEKLGIVEEKSLKGIKDLKKEIKYEFHKWKKQLLISDKVITLLVILFLGLLSPDYVVIAAYFIIIPYLILTRRKVLFYHLMVSSAVALIWMLIAKNEYSYNQDFLIIWGIDLFPLFSWATGLFAIYVIYSHYEHILNEQSFIHKLLLFIAFYFPFIIGAETIAYHFFNIYNIAAVAYPGLPICDCIHAPRWMQAAYFAMGPIFFAVCHILKLENPHFKIPKKIT